MGSEFKGISSLSGIAPKATQDSTGNPFSMKPTRCDGCSIIPCSRNRLLRPTSNSSEAIVFPAEVESCNVTDAASFDPSPDHFLAVPLVTLNPPQEVPELRVRVVSQFVQRIVWRRIEGQNYRPGFVFFRDGRSLAFRSARPGRAFVSSSYR